MLAASTAVASWLLTYAVHSTLLLGTAWLAVRGLGLHRLGLQQALLRTVLLGGCVTSSLALAVPSLPAFRGWLSGEALVSGRPSVADVVPSAPHTQAAPTVLERLLVRLPEGWTLGLVSAWLIGAGIAGARLVDGTRRLRRMVSDRREITSGPLVERVALIQLALGLKRAVDLTASARIMVPFAAGVRRPMVCIPERALVSLPLSQQAGLCAHELAHVARHDPAWNTLCRFLEAAFFFQPLIRWASDRLRAVAECAADDVGATACGEPLALAQSLVGVAGWTTGEPPWLPVAGALSMRSLLGKRVERLMHGKKETEAGKAVWAFVFAGALMGIAPNLPSVSAAVPAGQPAGRGIIHEPIGCVTEGRFFEIDAAVEPSSSVEKASLFFAPSGSAHDYSVEMVLRDNRLVGRLPKPKATASPISYYIEVHTKDARVLKTDRYSVLVVTNQKECPRGTRLAPVAQSTEPVSVHKKDAK
jgi:beta-lactamase regulating signal transducer with metallopeptidase domain